MKKVYSWLVILTILLIFLFFRLAQKFFISSKLIFKNKNIVGIELKKFKIELDDKTKVWSVLKNNRVYKSNNEEVNELINNIKNLQVLEIVSKDINKYKEYSLDEGSANKIKILIKKNKKRNTFTIFIGKQGVFSYNEFYIRFENKPYIYIAKGIENRWLLEREFYDYCDRRILSSLIDNINYLELNYNNQIFNYKKTLQNGSTVWISVEKNKEVKENKIKEFIKNFENFVSDGILTDEDINKENLKVFYEIRIVYEKSDVKILIYDKIQKDTFVSLYPVRVKTSNPNIDSQSIKFLGEEDLYYFVYEYRYKQFIDFFEN